MNEQLEEFKIIIADDTPDNVSLLKRRLRSPNYTFYTASDGRQTLELVRSVTPDLLLLDVNMPKMDGFEVCRRLRMDKDTRDIPVIIITAARTTLQDQVEGLGLGADDYITKPFKSRELVARVKRKLQIRSRDSFRKRLSQTILSTGEMRMLVVNREMLIAESSDGLEDLLNIPRVVDAPLLDALPELMGYEDTLADIAAGKQENLSLLMLNRLDREGQNRYLNFTVWAYPDPNKPGYLLVIIADASETGHLRQKATQQRNELRLMSEKLIRLNYQLDYVLRRYVPADVVDAIMEKPKNLESAGELRHLSILFADMRGYTKLSHKLPPERVMSLLNEYLHLASESIAEFDGMIAQYMGDAIMAMFNAVLEQPDHAWQAVQAGLAIQKAIAAHLPSISGGEEAIQFGVGIFTGPALVGNTGARWQQIFSAIGHTVNMAYRLTMLAERGEILIGEETYQIIKDRIETKALPSVKVKGVDRPVPIYRVEGLGKRKNQPYPEIDNE